MKQMCPWCEVNAGRTHGERRCCKLRQLALAPRHHQKSFAETLTPVERAALRPLLLAEIARLEAIRQK